MVQHFVLEIINSPFLNQVESIIIFLTPPFNAISCHLYTIFLSRGCKKRKHQSLKANNKTTMKYAERSEKEQQQRKNEQKIMKIPTICIRRKIFHTTIIQPFPIVLLKFYSNCTIKFLTPRPTIKQRSSLSSRCQRVHWEDFSFLFLYFSHFLNQFHPTTKTTKTKITATTTPAAQIIFIFFFSFMLSERCEGRVFFFHNCCCNFPFNFPSSHHTLR